MNLKKILFLANKASKGEDSIEEGAVGYYGYGFVLREFDDIIQTINFPGSNKVCCLGRTKNELKDFKRKINVIENAEYYTYFDDILFIGSIKTLVPNLKLGKEYEYSFEVWMFVRTPDNKQFPVRVYYGPSGLAIGGWDPDWAYNFTKDDRFLSIFPKNFKSEINFSPHDFSKDEIEAFSEAFELAVRKVPISDFLGIYMHDYGNRLMGIKNGKPINIELGFSPKFDSLNFFLNYTMKLNIDKKKFEKWNMH